MMELVAKTAEVTVKAVAEAAAKAIERTAVAVAETADVSAEIVDCASYADIDPDARIETDANSKPSYDYQQEFDDVWKAWDEFRFGETRAYEAGYNRPGITYLESSEYKAYEYGLNNCREVAQHNFSPEVIEEWAHLPEEYRIELATQYARDIADALNINVKGVVFEQCDIGVSGYTLGDGIIHLDNSLVKEPGNIVRLADTITHETRHVFQLEAILNPNKFGLDATTLAEWRDAYETYGDNEDYSYYNPLGYYYNPLETDARSFGVACAQAVVRNWRTQNVA